MAGSQVCVRCKVHKPYSEYYTTPTIRDGHVGACKACHRAEKTARRLKYRDEFRRAAREEYATKPAVRARCMRNAKKQSRTERRKHCASYEARHPERRKAIEAVYQAVQSGRLTRPSTCSECDEGGKIEAHHDDYSKPLDVRWLCTKCHGLTRRKGYERKEMENA